MHMCQVDQQNNDRWSEELIAILSKIPLQALHQQGCSINHPGAGNKSRFRVLSFGSFKLWQISLKCLCDICNLEKLYAVQVDQCCPSLTWDAWDTVLYCAMRWAGIIISAQHHPNLCSFECSLIKVHCPAVLRAGCSHPVQESVGFLLVLQRLFSGCDLI